MNSRTLRSDALIGSFQVWLIAVFFSLSCNCCLFVQFYLCVSGFFSLVLEVCEWCACFHGNQFYLPPHLSPLQFDTGLCYDFESEIVVVVICLFVFVVVVCLFLFLLFVCFCCCCCCCFCLLVVCTTSDIIHVRNKVMDHNQFLAAVMSEIEEYLGYEYLGYPYNILLHKRSRLS